MKILLVFLLAFSFSACNWRNTQDESDILAWHEHHRVIAEINARWVAKCGIRKQELGLDAIGDIACVDRPQPPLAAPAKK